MLYHVMTGYTTIVPVSSGYVRLE